jgi:transposase
LASGDSRATGQQARATARRRRLKGSLAIAGDLQRENERLKRENQRLKEQLTERDKRIADQERQVADKERQVANREQQIADKNKEIAEAEKRIEKLERELAARKKNSTNSSKPPSSDGIAGEQRPRKKRKRRTRRPGGQKGHDGAHRPLVDVEQVDEIVALLPPECKHCGHALPQSGEKLETSGALHRHQVTELPPIKPHITEYQCPKVICPDCGGGTRAPLPPELQPLSGPQLTALIGYLTVVCRMPRRVVEAFLADALHISVSLGSVQKAWEETSEAVQQPYQELQEQLKREPVLNSDETSWRNNGEKRWIWALIAPCFVFYTVAANRSAEILVHLLGSVFQGILCSDRAAAYLKYHKGSAQYCWAHLKRNILGVQAFAKTTEAGQFCRNALALHARLFRLWHRFRGNEAHRRELHLKSLPIQKKFFELADRHINSADAEVRNLARVLFFHSDRLFTFLEAPGVEPTNNVAERALRIAVQWRKIVFGNRSKIGEIATARLLTATQTCKVQQHSSLEYLTEAIRCHRRGQKAPSLLPQQR